MFMLLGDGASRSRSAVSERKERGQMVRLSFFGVLTAALAALAASLSVLAGPAEGTAQAQDGTSSPGQGEQVEATGFLSPVFPPDPYSHLLNDETTGGFSSLGARWWTSTPSTTARESAFAACWSTTSGCRHPSWKWRRWNRWPAHRTGPPRFRSS